MSEQLETIKCSDWTINSFWAAGGGSGAGRSPSAQAGCPSSLLFFPSLLFNPQRCTWSVMQQSIRLGEAARPPNTWPLA